MTAEEMTTDDLKAELERRETSKKERGKHVKKHGVGVSALLIAAFGAYQGYANKAVAEIAAETAAEAKVDTSQDRDDLVGAINELKKENAALRASLDAQETLDKERYEQLRQWLRSVSSRVGGHEAPPEAVEPDLTIEDMPKPAPPPPVKMLSKKRPQKRDEDYMQQVQQVLEEKGFKK